MSIDEQHVKPSGAQYEVPAPRVGDEFTSARIIINAARLVMSAGAPRPHFEGGETRSERRTILADFLRAHGVPVPAFVPVKYGWMDCDTGRLANPRHEPGANGRSFS